MTDHTRASAMILRDAKRRYDHPLPFDAVLSHDDPEPHIPEGFWTWKHYEPDECECCGVPTGEVTTHVRMLNLNLEFS